MGGAYRPLVRLMQGEPRSMPGCLIMLVIGVVLVLVIIPLSNLWGLLCGMVAVRWPETATMGILSCVVMFPVTFIWVGRRPLGSKLRILPTVLMALLTAYWMGGFMFSHYCGHKNQEISLTWDSPSLQFPLFELEAIAIGADDEIYCISKNYSRLQVFDQNGHFRRSWLVPIWRGTSFRMLMEEGRRVRISTRYQDTVYDAAGRLLSREKKEGALDNEADWGPQQTAVSDSKGNTYSIGGGLFSSGRVSKTSPDGTTSALLTNTFWQWLALPGCFYTWLFGGLAGIIAFVSSKIL